MKFARLVAVACGLLLGCYCFAQNLTGVSVSPASVPSGTPSIGTVTLSAPAPTGGVVVGLSSNAPAATVPTGVTVPQGATSATFSVGAHNSGYTKLAATITATVVIAHRKRKCRIVAQLGRALFVPISACAA